MGLFDKSPVSCDVCGKETGTPANEKHKTKDGVICIECFLAAGLPPKGSARIFPTEMIKEQISNTDGLTLLERNAAAIGQGAVAMQQALEEKKARDKELVNNYKNRNADEEVKCPRCGSTQISADKKGFGVGKAVVGAAMVGAVGLAAGGIGSKKVIVTCLKCGHQWKAGQGE